MKEKTNKTKKQPYLDLWLLSLLARKTKKDSFANNLEPDDLYCLPVYFEFWPTRLFATMDVSRLKMEESS